MRNITIDSIEDFLSLKGAALGESEWFEITQELIDHFADSTFDHQWIHVDEKKAQNEGPYGTTIAHGYLTLSLLPFLLDQILNVNNLKQVVNYGIEKVVYKNVVPVNSKIRLVASLKNAKDLGTICKADILCRIEIEGQDIPALVGIINYLYYFK